MPPSLYSLGLEQALEKAMNVQPFLENNDDLVKRLSGTRVNSHNHTPADDVAYDLLKAVLKKQWRPLSEDRKKRNIRFSGARIWKIYTAEIRRGQSHKSAAQFAIDTELTYLLRRDKAAF
jgi:hypothetical protein